MPIWTAGPADGHRLGRPQTLEEPDKISLAEDVMVVQVAIGWKHGHFFTDEHSFYSWGTGSSWRLGTGTKTNVPTPQRVKTFPEGTQFKQVACGDKFSAVTTQGGQLLVWGAGYAHTPTAFDLPSPAEFIACGQVCLLAALADGTVMYFYRHIPPVRHEFPGERIVSVAAGANHRLALSESGRVFSWGSSPATGQGIVESPRVIESLLDTPICAVFAYHNSSFFLDPYSKVWCCGTNSSGSLGLGHIEDVQAPVCQDFLFDGEQIVQIACGDDFTLYLTVCGNVWASGNGGDNRNATGSTETRVRPTLATRLSGRFISQVAVGCFNAAFLEDGCPPFNDMGQFRGDFRDFPVPAFPFRGKTRDRVGVEIDPSPAALRRFGLRAGDIVRFEGSERAKVIGGARGGVAVVREEKTQITVLAEEDPMAMLARHPLLERAGADLCTARTREGFDVVVDRGERELLPLGGFRAGDGVVGRGEPLVVIGARLELVWAIGRDGAAVGCRPEELEIVAREGARVRQLPALDGQVFVVEGAGEGEGLVHCGQCGLGYFAGTIGRKFVYMFLATPGRIAVMGERLPCARALAGDAEKVFVTREFAEVPLGTSVEATAATGFYAFDRVRVDGETYGTVVGAQGGLVGVRSDAEAVEAGLIEIVGPARLELVGRIDLEGFRRYGSERFSVNTADFVGTKFRPGDRVVCAKRRGIVVGVKDGVVFGAFDGEEGIAQITEECVRVASFLEIGVCERRGGVDLHISLMHCGLSHMKPGDLRRTLGGRVVEYLGFAGEKQLWFMDVVTGELEQLAVVDLDPDFYRADIF